LEGWHNRIYGALEPDKNFDAHGGVGPIFYIFFMIFMIAIL
jgi:hypothetical protein